MWTRPNSISSEKANVHPLVNKQPSTLVDVPAKSSVNGMSKSKSIELTTNVKAPAVMFPFEKSIADPRTKDTSTKPPRLPNGPAPVNKYPFANSWSKRTIKPTFEVEAHEPVFEFPFEKAIVVPRNIGTISMPTRFLNEPAPAFKHPLTKSVVDTSAKSKSIKPSIESQAPAPINKFPFEKSIVDPRTVSTTTMSTNFINGRVPGIKYPYANPIVDTRSKSKSTEYTTEVETPEAEIKFPFEKSVVDPRTFDQSVLFTNSRYGSPFPFTYPVSILAQTYGYRSMLKDYLMKLSGIINFNNLYRPILI